MKLSAQPVILILGDGLKNGNYKLYASFRRVDNFINTSGDLIALSSDASISAANSLIINKFAPAGFEELSIQNKRVLLDGKPTHTDSSIIYRSDIILDGVSCIRIIQQTKTFVYTNAHSFPSGSLLNLLTRPSGNKSDTPGFEKMLHAELEKAFSRFSEEFLNTLKAFRGKGGGLTPAGDDFIAGVLYGIHCLEATTGQNHSKIKQQVYELAKGDNIFSNTMLTMAQSGQFFKRLKDFLHAWLQCGQRETGDAFRQLLLTGQTSGADLIAGFFSLFLHQPAVLFDTAKNSCR